MILYFSATGNSKYVAQCLSKELNIEMVSVEETIPKLEGTLYLVAPTHYGQLAILMREFLEQADLENVKKVVLVITYGSTPGCTLAQTKKVLKQKGLDVYAGYGIQMPDTYTPFFDVSDKEKVSQQNQKANQMIKDMIVSIRKNQAGNHGPISWPGWTRLISNPLFEAGRQTKNFHVEQTCIGCGKCASQCPVDAIELKEGKPVWTKEKCVQCFRCLHNCPVFAIQYGQHTKKHGQYTHPEA